MFNAQPPKKVGFFILPGEERRVEDVLNNPHYVIINRKENFAVKEGVLMIYMEWEDNTPPTPDYGEVE